MRAVIITGKFVQDHEFIYPYYRLQEAGYTVDVATVDGCPTVGALGTTINANCTFEAMWDIEIVSGYDLIVIPGGAKCMEYLRQNKVVLEFIRKFYEQGKIVASICHGAQMLISAKIISGKKVSGYYSIADDINNAGAHYVTDPVVSDGNIISSPHYKYMPQWMKAVIENVEKNTHN